MGADQSTANQVPSAEPVTDERSRLQEALTAFPLDWTAGSAADAPSARETSGTVAGKTGEGDVCLFVAAGRAAQQEFNDVHCYTSGTGWKNIMPSGPAPRLRSGHALVHAQLTLDNAQGESAVGPGLVLFGGMSSDRGYLSDTMALNLGDECAWTVPVLSGDFPCARDKHTLVLLNGKIVVFGGFGIVPPDHNDTDGAGVESEDDEEDADEDGGSGGKAIEMGWFNDLYLLDPTCWRWAKVSMSKDAAKPTPRAAHSACVLALSGGGEPESMLVFGGRAAKGRVNDVWVFDGAQWHAPRATGTVPAARSFHACAALNTPAGRPVAAVYGGLDTAGAHMSDLHLLDATEWVWARVQLGNVPRARGSAAFGAVGAQLLLFGGSSDWKAESGGATTFHADTHHADLSIVVKAIDTTALAGSLAAQPASVANPSAARETKPAEAESTTTLFSGTPSLRPGALGAVPLEMMKILPLAAPAVPPAAPAVPLAATPVPPAAAAGGWGAFGAPQQPVKKCDPPPAPPAPAAAIPGWGAFAAPVVENSPKRLRTEGGAELDTNYTNAD